MEILNCQEQSEGSSFLSSGHELIIKNGIPRSLGLVSAGQEQTKEAFALNGANVIHLRLVLLII